MATQIGSLVVDLTLKFAKFSSDLEKTSGQVTSTANRIQSTFTGMATAIGAVITTRMIRQLVRITDESLKLAATLDNDLGRSAQRFISQAEGMSNAFQLGVAKGFLDEINSGLLITEDSLKKATTAGQGFGIALGTATKAAGFFFGTVIPDVAAIADHAIQTLLDKLDRFRGQMQEITPGGLETRLGIQQEDATAAALASDAMALTTQRTKEAAEAATAAGKAFADLASLSNAAFEKARTPMEQYAATIERLNFLLKEGGINAETYGRLQMMAAANAVSPWLQVADKVGEALGTMFKDNKAVAIAQAVINTAQGITAALAAYPPPLSFAMAAAVAAAGAAQIATIMSATPGTSKKPTAGSGAGAGAGTGKGQGRTSTSPTGGQSVFVQLQGGPMFSQEAVRGLIAQINEAVGDGATIRMA